MENETLVKLYENSNETGRKILIDQYGQDAFIDDNDYMKLFEGFCKDHNLVFADIVPFKDPKTTQQHSVNAHAMLQEIVPLENEGYVPNWDNSNEYKYYPWFYMPSSGSGFAFYSTDSWISYAVAGSRLCFRTSERCELIAKKYLPIYKKWLNK